MIGVPGTLAAVLAAAASLATASSALAECVVRPVDTGRDFRSAAVVFAGTIIDGNDERLTFRTDRIWKGHPPATVTIHLRERPSLDGYRFRTGERHLVFARVIGRDDPDGLPEGVLAMPRGCGAPPWPLTLAPELDRLARPRRGR